MDQDAYRRTYRELNDRFCAFEKSVLSSKCRCTRSSKIHLAEREGVHCESDQFQTICIEFLETLRHHARFALKLNDEAAALPHGKAMRLQVGGLRGVFASLNPEREIPDPIADIETLLREAIGSYGSIDKLPFQNLIQQVSAYKGRPSLRSTR
ncbi:hypothetical protein Ga0074115_1216 [endosymbiont of Ridgeia piscesae]|jgi:hypothetical protein|uniref:Uncharacterized protein n=3 Tax=endosymbiont of Ridgeia piscesae TaxID=54398 RepID=A0A0T5YY48_9GAMM|nr:hypothetical protein [endosymbiont of Ridgeia piscesae]KRT55584.1 hypothetical protein Ga0074115_1216 [endosymbiont of Ridgeia piscesae]